MFINGGYPVDSWNGLTPARIEKVAEFLPNDKFKVVQRVYTAFTKKKGLAISDAIETLRVVQEVEVAMGQRFMEVAPPNPHANEKLMTKENAWMLFSLVLAAITFLAGNKG